MASRKRKRSRKTNTVKQEEDLSSVPMLDLEQLLFADLSPARNEQVFSYISEDKAKDAHPSLAQELANNCKEEVCGFVEEAFTGLGLSALASTESSQPETCASQALQQNQETGGEFESGFITSESPANELASISATNSTKGGPVESKVFNAITEGSAWQRDLFTPQKLLEQLNSQIAAEFQRGVETGAARVVEELAESELVKAATKSADYELKSSSFSNLVINPDSGKEAETELNSELEQILSGKIIEPTILGENLSCADLEFFSRDEVLADLQDPQYLFKNLKGIELIRLEVVSAIYDFLSKKFYSLLKKTTLESLLKSRGLLSYSWQQSLDLGVEVLATNKYPAPASNQGLLSRPPDFNGKQLLNLWLPTATWSSLPQLPSLLGLITCDLATAEQDLARTKVLDSAVTANSDSAESSLNHSINESDDEFISQYELQQILKQEYQLDLVELSEYLSENLTANTLAFLELSEAELELIRQIVDYSDSEQYCSELEQINYRYFLQLPIFPLLLEIYRQG